MKRNRYIKICTKKKSAQNSSASQSKASTRHTEPERKVNGE